MRLFIESMVNGYRAAGVPIDADVVKEARKEVDMNELIEGIVPVYDKFYTEGEMIRD